MRVDMFYRREIIKTTPDKIRVFNEFFHHYLLPNQIKNGAKLIGRWITEDQHEIVAIWEYPSYDEYVKIEKRVQKDEWQKLEHTQRLKIGKLNLNSYEDFLSPTGEYHSTTQNVSVSGYITNEREETLLVQTYWRPDTWELPGGGVDEGETLDVALCREILEETGIEVLLQGVTGVYSNGSTISIIFRGISTGGQLRMTSHEIKDVRFVKLDASMVGQYIKRKKFIPRVLDAMKEVYVPFEAFKVRPYELVKRMDGKP